MQRHGSMKDESLGERYSSREAGLEHGPMSGIVLGAVGRASKHQIMENHGCHANMSCVSLGAGRGF